MFIRLNSWLAILLVLLVCLAGSPLAAAEHGGHGSGAEGEGELNPNPLVFKTDLAIWTAVVFLVLLAILWRFAWGPIADGLQKREGRIAEDIASAERANQEAKRLLASYEERLARAEDEVKQLVEQGRRDAAEVGRQMLDKARADAEAEKRRALGEIDQATTAALKDLAERSATLAVDLAGKIVGARLDSRAHSQLIQQAVDGFSKSKPNGN